MAFWRHSREEPVAVRSAGPADRAALSALLARTWRRQGNLSPEDQVALLQAGLSPIAYAADEAVGFLGLSQRSASGSPPEIWVDVTLVALDANRPPDATLQALLDEALALLRHLQYTGLVCLTALSWLQEGMERGGFAEQDRILTYIHNDVARVPVAAQPAEIRTAGARDGELILDINARAFGPFWQYDDATVLSWLLTSDHAVLAYAGGQPAGFALTTEGLPGNYAHLIRVATDPPYQGRGVGRQLVVDALRHAYQAGAPGLALNTQASNSVSRRLYESLGFRSTGQVLSVMVCRL
jgi:[ribosomal protein S18]-alanine N-acetyltransferase